MASGGPRETSEPGPEPAGAQGPQANPRPGVDRQLATMTGRSTFAALQLGATLGATLGGLVLYGFLLGLRVNNLIAVLLGFGFALLSRRAITSLTLEWMRARTRQRTGARPEMPDEPPRR